jgi:ATP-dependent helicase/nuclease subunit A
VGDELNFTHPPPSLAWSYPFAAATREAAKTSVSALRHKISEAAEETRPWWRVRSKPDRPAAGLSAAQVGTAHHTFLEFADLAKLTSTEGVAAEAGHLVAAGMLSAKEVQRLDHRALARFWKSAEGRKWLGALSHLRRELPFTARFSVARFRELGLPTEMLAPDEFVVVQGVVDLAVILQGEIWILDFKTDDITRDQMNAKVEFYTPQLKLYAAALAGIYGRPVSEVALHFLSTGETSPIFVK